VLTEDVIDSLCKLGLTINQARVYSIIASKTTIKIRDIAILTKIHEQDIYKILPKLEQTGLITKITTKPLVVEALPPVIALKGLIKKQRENFEEAEKNTQKFIEKLESERANHWKEELEEKVLIFNNTSTQSYRNNALASLIKVRKTFDALGERDSIEQFLRFNLPYLKEFEKVFVKYQVKVRILSRYRDSKNFFNDIDLKPLSNFNVEIKTVRSSTYKSLPFLTYFIIDGKELRATTMKYPTSSSKVITIDCMSIMQIAQEHFEKSWQDSNAELIFSTKPSQQAVSTSD
jgi:sugar-specific transcriptional regulator TrmB